MGKDLRLSVPKWVREGLGITPGDEFAVSVWPKGQKILLDGDAVVLEVIRVEAAEAEG